MAMTSTSNGHLAGIASMMQGKINLPATTAELQVQYKNAKPFPYLVLDNLFPADTLEDMMAELPPMTDDKWVHDRNENSVKSNLRSAVDLGPHGFQFAAFLNSAAFLYLLSEMTDIWGLLGDPYLGGAGYHVVPAGGKFNVHADRNTDMSTGLFRRLAMLTYLNHDWDPAFGGQLELWNDDATRCEKVVEPIFNRTLIMEIGDKNFHAVRPVFTDSRARMSFATYYHTVGANDLKPHSSIYAPTFYQKKEPLGKRLAKDWLPPVVLRTLKSMK
jgi:hypothetical protein